MTRKPGGQKEISPVRCEIQEGHDLNGDMTMVETDLEVDVAESLVKERWRQEDQLKKYTTKAPPWGNFRNNF